MKCSKCGVELSEGEKFCAACGAKVEAAKFCAACGAKLTAGAAVWRHGRRIGHIIDNSRYLAYNNCYEHRVSIGFGKIGKTTIHFYPPPLAHHIPLTHAHIHTTDSYPHTAKDWRPQKQNHFPYRRPKTNEMSVL